MLKKSFNLDDSLKAVTCPRCCASGLEGIDYDTFVAAPAINRHQATCTIDPSKPVRCPACELVMEWPGCSE